MQEILINLKNLPASNSGSTLSDIKQADDLEREKKSLKEHLRNVHQELQVLVEWETANLVLHGMSFFHHLTNTLTEMPKIYSIC